MNTRRNRPLNHSVQRCIRVPVSLGKRKAATAGCGFTLIEVMVALFIVAMALPALLTQVSAQLDGTIQLREKSQAAWVAENALLRLTLQSQLSGLELAGESNGSELMAGRQWYWRVVAEETVVPGLWRLVSSAGLQDGQVISTVETFTRRQFNGVAVAGQ